MKFLTYGFGGQQAGLLHEPSRGIIPLADVLGPGGDVLGIIRHWESVLDYLAEDPQPTVALDDVDVLAPIPRPARNIFCIGKNYSEHVQEFERSGYDATRRSDSHDKPVFFSKSPSTVIGPGMPIEPHEDITQEVDYEVELAVLIGTGGRSISREDALAHVWGYTIVNDVTARDLQRDHQQWFLGKSLDGFCPMGPFAVTASDIDLADTSISSYVNGELRQQSNTRYLIHTVPDLIVWLSAGIRLEPGDIIATGTPSGVGIGFDPPRFLSPGDVIDVEVGGIGTLTNTFGSLVGRPS